MTTADELLMWGLTPQSRSHFSGSLVPAENPLFVICGAHWVVLWCGLKLTLGELVLEPLRRFSGLFRPRSANVGAWLKAAWWEL